MDSNLDFYKEINRNYDTLYKYPIDSLKRINFHQIFYIEDDILKSFIAAASPNYPVYTSKKVFIGNTDKSFCCVNTDYKSQNIGEDIFLGNTYNIFNFDSLEMSNSIKKTYNMNLVAQLWFLATKERVQIIDIVKNKKIKSKDIRTYSIDSLETETFVDSIWIKRIVYGEPVGRYLTNSIALSQNWFYSKKRKVFFSKITGVYLYVKRYEYIPELKNSGQKLEKRFSVIFK